MNDADKRIEALIERAGCPMMVVKNTEQKSFEDVRRSILRVADEEYDGSLIEYIRDLSNTIDRMEDALENVIIERDAALAKVPKWISVEERLPEKLADKDGTLVNYLIYMPEYGVDVGNYMQPAKVWVCMGIPCKVTHWMPLPEPPEEQKDTKGE